MIEFERVQPEVLTAEEACRYLRLDEGRDVEAGLRSLTRLVDSGRLTPAMIGRHRRYSLTELRAFIAREVEKYERSRNGGAP